MSALLFQAARRAGGGLGSPPIAPGNPVVTNVSGTISDGSTVTITGGNFSVKSPAKPLAFADFESSLQPVAAYSIKAAWDHDSSHDSAGWELSAADTAPGSSAQASRWDMSRDTTPNRFTQFGHNPGATPEDKMYFFLKRKYAFTQAQASNLKYFRFYNYENTAPYANLYIAALFGEGIWTTEYLGSNSSYFVTSGSSDPGGSPPRNEWFTQELIYRGSSDNGVADGFLNYLENNANPVEFSPDTALLTRTGGQSNGLHAFWIQDDVSNDSFPSNYVYYDDVYMDNTWARVMVGNASTYAACTEVEVALPTAWSDTSITVDLRQGALESLSGAYLYVFDADGNANATGYQI